VSNGRRGRRSRRRLDHYVDEVAVVILVGLRKRIGVIRFDEQVVEARLVGRRERERERDNLCCVHGNRIHRHLLVHSRFGVFEQRYPGDGVG